VYSFGIAGPITRGVDWAGGIADPACPVGTVHTVLRFVSTKEDSVKAIVDETLCSGCGVCEEMAPDVFAMNDAGTVDVKVDPIPEDLQGSAQEAADGCPSGAIVIEA